MKGIIILLSLILSKKIFLPNSTMSKHLRLNCKVFWIHKWGSSSMPIDFKYILDCIRFLILKKTLNHLIIFLSIYFHSYNYNCKNNKRENCHAYFLGDCFFTCCGLLTIKVLLSLIYIIFCRSDHIFLIINII